MKKNTNHMIRGWLLLLCFAAGQYVVWSHQHPVRYSSSTAQHQNRQPKQVLTENCQLCDAMHHNYMALHTQVYFAPVVVTQHIYKPAIYAFTSIALILSSGRAPPMA